MSRFFTFLALQAWFMLARTAQAQPPPPPPPPPPGGGTPTPTLPPPPAPPPIGTPGGVPPGGPAPITTLPEPSVTSIQDFYIALKAVALWMLVFGIILGVLFVIIGGISILTSRGDEQKLRTGKQTLTWAVVGIVLLVLAFSIVNIVARFFGVQGNIINPSP